MEEQTEKGNGKERREREPEGEWEHPAPNTTTALEAVSRAEIDVQIATAHRFPRSVTQFMREAMDMACLDTETAASCRYALPREGKVIEGPSVRLAEIVASTWQHLHTAGRIIEEGRTYLVAQGVAIDLQRNNRRVIEVRRRIVDKKGRRYTEDMVNVTANAAISIACRNAIFQVVPRAYWQRVYDKAKDTARGDAKTLDVRRTAAVEYFKSLGVKKEWLLAKLVTLSPDREIKGIEDLGLADLDVLHGMVTAIKDGDTSLDQLFPEMAAAGTAAPDAAAALAEQLRAQAAGTTAGATTTAAAAGVVAAVEATREREPGADDVQHAETKAEDKKRK